MPTLEQRVEDLNRKFGFRENPEDFNFELNPERIAYKNEALRKKDRNLYAGYLADNYPKQMEKELQDFDTRANKIRYISKDEAEQLFEQNKINLLKSDLHFRDADAIFQLKKVDPSDLNWHLEAHETDLLNGNSRPYEAVDGKEGIWIEG